jgi:hypothetical protein
MTTNKDDNAFPQAYYNSEDLNLEVGLTKREYFAALALQGLLQNPQIRWTVAGNLAVDIADDLIENLNKPT